jgi:hypothetical protein
MDFELKPRISPSEKDFFLKLGSNWVNEKNEIFSEILEKTNCTCGGCGYRVHNEDYAHKILQLHLIEENEESLKDSLFITLCKACHTTQHIDKAIEQGWVNVVNSSYSQKSLIEMCRISTIGQHLRDGEVRILKTTPMEYLDDLKNETLPLHSRVKVIFTNKFDWGDL